MLLFSCWLCDVFHFHFCFLFFGVKTDRKEFKIKKKKKKKRESVQKCAHDLFQAHNTHTSWVGHCVLKLIMKTRCLRNDATLGLQFLLVFLCVSCQWQLLLDCFFFSLSLLIWTKRKRDSKLVSNINLWYIH